MAPSKVQPFSSLIGGESARVYSFADREGSRPDGADRVADDDDPASKVAGLSRLENGNASRTAENRPPFPMSRYFRRG